jgi:hypothetical protein
MRLSTSPAAPRSVVRSDIRQRVVLSRVGDLWDSGYPDPRRVVPGVGGRAGRRIDPWRFTIGCVRGAEPVWSGR